jgi:HPt (histidine-containing phosphotransfer) domain-containing protein
VALSANAVSGAMESFIQSGMNDFIPKPIDARILNNMLLKYLPADKIEKIDEQGEKLEEKRSGFLGGLPTVEGVNFSNGFNRFGEKDIYLDIIKTFINTTPAQLDIIRNFEPFKSSLNDYIIIVHGIKSASRSIGAEIAGTKAEQLEHAGKQGDIEFIMANNNDFIRLSEKLIEDLKTIITQQNNNVNKPRALAPDKTVLLKLSKACATYDMLTIETAMEELLKYDYEQDGDLVIWLEEQINNSEFLAITEKLSNII